MSFNSKGISILRATWLVAIAAAFIWVLDLLVPKRRRQICYVSDPDCSDNPLALFLHQVKEHPELKAVWLIRGEIEAAEKRLKRQLPPGALGSYILVRKNSFFGLYHALSSRVLVSSHATYRFLWSSHRRISLSLWHGMPLKRVGLLDGNDIRMYGRITHGIATSDFFAAIVGQCFDLPLERVWVTGMPRDDLMWGEHVKEFRSAVAPAGERLCLFMPTFRIAVSGEIRSDTSFSDARIPLIEDRLDWLDERLFEGGWRLVVKFHPMDKLNTRNWTKAYKAIKIMTHSEFSKFGVDVYALVGSADKLITDFSSVFVDYKATGRPVGFAVDLGEVYTRGLTIDMPLDEFLPGPVLTTADDFADFVLSAINSVEDVYETRAKRMQEFSDAQSARRVMNRLSALMND